MKSTTSHEDQFSPEPTPQEEEAWREMERRQSSPVAPQPNAETALDRYRASGAMVEEKDPLERLRFFCSLAMSGQDWLDVEPFFDAVAAQAQPAVNQSLTTDQLADAGKMIEPLQYGHDKSDDYVTGWNDCVATLSSEQPVSGAVAAQAQTITPDDAKVCAEALRNGLSPTVKMFIPAGWNTLLDKLDAIATQQPVSGADGLTPGIKETIRLALIAQHDAGKDQSSCDDALNWLGSQPQPSGNAPLHPAVREAIEAAFEQREGWMTKIAAAVRYLPDESQPSGNAEQLDDAVRVLLDSLHADAVYLLSRVKQGSLSVNEAAQSIRSRIDEARSALAQKQESQS